ncbi:ERF family protein [Streptomyces bottropensis]|uniref:ERF family protein n=1 Tax=Streptomyces bottropensis TaxID=42235 RepID=UPI0037934DDE
MTVTALHPAQPAPVAEDEPPLIKTAYEPAPAGAPAELPRVFQVIHGVMRDVMPVAKGQQNTQQNYKFRGVDDAMSAMAGPMRNHGCFIAPELAEHHQRPRGDKGTHTVIKMRYRIYGPAGDCLLVTVPGEAMDTADKSTNKAMSAALKYMLFQVFMIPVDARSIDDSDRDAPEPPAEHRAEHQRNQQRRQQRQQRGQQQPRRSNRAEPGPWEQPQQQARQQRPDYVAAARKADSREQFAKIRAAAVDAGAPADYLAQLDAIAANKANGSPCGCGPREVCDQCRQTTTRQERRDRPGPQQQGSTAPTGPAPHSASDAVAAEGAIPAGVATAEQAAAEAENLLRLAASRAHLATLDADFERVYGLPIEQATAAQLDQFRAKIEAAGGAQ